MIISEEINRLYLSLYISEISTAQWLTARKDVAVCKILYLILIFIKYFFSKKIANL